MCSAMSSCASRHRLRLSPFAAALPGRFLPKLGPWFARAPFFVPGARLAEIQAFQKAAPRNPVASADQSRAASSAANVLMSSRTCTNP